MSFPRRRLILGTAVLATAAAGLFGALGSALAVTATTTTTPIACVPVSVSPTVTRYTMPPYSPSTRPPLSPSTTRAPGGTTPPTSPVSPSPACAGALSGRLLDNGAPVTGVTVDLWSMSGNPNRTAVTDAQGAYRLDRVTPGRYRMRYALPGGFTQWYPGVEAFSEAGEITITSSTETVVDDTLMPHATLSGRLTAKGQPVAGMNVTLSRSDGVGGYTYTGADGSFSLSYLPPGQYRIGFGGSEPGQQIQWAPQRRSEETAGVYTAVAGQRLELTEALLPRGVVTGTYRYAGSGSPVSGAMAFIRETDGSGVASTTVDANGQFRFDVIHGTYLVEFVRPDGRSEWWRTGTSAAQARRVWVGADATVTLSMTTLPSGTVSGRVTAPDGTPVENVLVTLTHPDRPQVQRVRTDAAGAWSIPDVLTGRSFVVHYLHNQQMQWARGETSRAAADRVAVSANRTTVVNERLLPSGSLAVTAYDRVTGEPLNHFCVELDNSGEKVHGCASYADPTTARFDALGPGTYKVTVNPGGGNAASATVTVQSGQTASVRIAVP